MNWNCLNLENLNKITDEGLRHLTNLTSLHLKFNRRITDKGLQPLTKLTTLDLTNNTTITEPGIQHLTELTRIDINRSNLTGRVFKYRRDSRAKLQLHDIVLCYQMQG